MRKSVTLLLAFLIVAVTLILILAIFAHIYRFPATNYTFLGSTHSLTHWFGWIGTIYIFIATPAQPIIKRLAQKYYKAMLNIHMFGNLLAVMFISIHFAQQVTRPPNAFPELGTGVVLYASMILLVATGLVRYSGVLRSYWRQGNFLHASLAITFYLVIIVHILHGISII